MSEEKLLVLNMLKEGKISEEEALRLLEAMGEDKGLGEEEENKFRDFEENVVGKITSSLEKLFKKTSETIQNIDFEDFNIGFGTSSGRFKSRTEKSQSLEISEVENPHLKINIRNGRIQMYPWDNEFIECRAKINYDEKLVGLDHEFFVLKKEDRDIIIEPVYHIGGSQPFELNLEVSIPRRFFESMNISTTNGSVEVGLVETNYLEIESTNGKLMLNSNSAEKTVLNTTNAKIEIVDHSGKELHVTSTNGKIVLNGLYVKETEIKTTNGSVSVQDISNLCSKLSTYTTNGSIRIGIGSFVRGVKVEFNKMNKHTSKVNLSDRFTSIVQEGKDVIAYTEGFTEEAEDSLRLYGSTVNGSINVE